MPLANTASYMSPTFRMPQRPVQGWRKCGLLVDFVLPSNHSLAYKYICFGHYFLPFLIFCSSAESTTPTKVPEPEDTSALNTMHRLCKILFMRNCQVAATKLIPLKCGLRLEKLPHLCFSIRHLYVFRKRFKFLLKLRRARANIKFDSEN